MAPTDIARTARTAAALLAAVALLAVACSSSPAVNSGPLGNGGDPGGICALVRPGVVFSFGANFLPNKGGSNAVITKVGLIRPRSLQLVASYVVPVTGNYSPGAWDGFPPGSMPRGEWPHRARTVGAVIPPLARPVQFYALISVLKATGPVAQAAGVDLIYREAGTQYEMQTDYGFVLLQGRDCPSNWPQMYPDDSG